MNAYDAYVLIMKRGVVFHKADMLNEAEYLKLRELLMMD